MRIVKKVQSTLNALLKINVLNTAKKKKTMQIV